MFRSLFPGIASRTSDDASRAEQSAGATSADQGKPQASGQASPELAGLQKRPKQPGAGADGPAIKPWEPGQPKRSAATGASMQRTLGGIGKTLKQIRKTATVIVGNMQWTAGGQGADQPNRLLKLSRFSEGHRTDMPDAARDALSIPKLEALAEAPLHLAEPTAPRQGGFKDAARNALASVGLSKGAAPQRVAVADALTRAKAGRSAQTRAHAPAQNGVSQATGLLRGKLDLERKHKQAQVLMTLAEGLEETQPEVPRLRQKLIGNTDLANQQIQAATRAASEEAIATMLVPGASDEQHEQLRQAMKDLVHKAALTDAPLSVRLLAELIPTQFANEPDLALQALASLKDDGAAAIWSRLREAVDMGAAAEQGEAPSSPAPLDPALRLLAAMVALPSGSRLTERLIEPMPGAGQGGDAMRTTLTALHHWVELGRPPDAASVADRAWLRDAILGGTASILGMTDVTTDPAQAMAQRLAYRAVENGFTSNAPGSPLDKLRTQVQREAQGALQDIAMRNARAAAGRSGRLANHLSAALPESVGAPLSPLRKSALNKVVKSAVRTGFLPTRSEGIESLHLSASDIRQALEQPNGLDTPAKQVALAVLDTLRLATPDGPPQPSALKHLGQAFFREVERQVGMQSWNRLDEGFKADWQALVGQHPNAGHVLRTVFDHLDLRTLLGVPAPQPLGQASLSSKGARADELAAKALTSIKAMTQDMRTQAQAPSGQAKALLDLVEVSAGVLDQVKPKAALTSVRIEHFEAIETDLVARLMASAGEIAPADLSSARAAVFASWPAALKAEWDEMKVGGADAARVLRVLLTALLAAQPRSTATSPAMRQAHESVAHYQSDAHVRRFEQSVADILTLHRDVRSSRDVALLAQSLVSRVSLGERVRSSAGNNASADIGTVVSVALSAASACVVMPRMGVARSEEQVMEFSMYGGALQMHLSAGQGSALTGGLAAGMPFAGGKDFKINLPQLDIQARAALQSAHTREETLNEGLMTRIERVSGAEDLMRRELADVVAHLYQGEAGVDANGVAYPDLLSSLMDKFPAIVFTNSALERKVSTGVTDVSVAAGAWKPRAVMDNGAKDPSYHTPGGGVVLGGASRATQVSSEGKEARAHVTTEEYKVGGNRLTEGRASVGMSINIENRDTRDAHVKPQVMGALVGGGLQQVANREMTLRRMTRKGRTWDAQSQLINEFSSFSEFRRHVSARMPEMLSAMALRDPVNRLNPQLRTQLGDEASDAALVARAHERLDTFLERAKAIEAPATSYFEVIRMQPQTAEALDDLLSLAQIAAMQGDHSRKASCERELKALLADDNAFALANWQIKTRSRAEDSKGVAAGFFSTKTQGEVMVLHEFVPLGRQNVGHTDNMLRGTPLDHSSRMPELGSHVGEAEVPVRENEAPKTDLLSLFQLEDLAERAGADSPKGTSGRN